MRAKKKKANRVETVTLGFFDSSRYGEDDLRLKYVNTPIEEVENITYDDYKPWGGTPLNDCTIEFLSVLEKAQKDDPSKLHIGLLGDESGSMDRLRGDVIEGFNTFLGDIKADTSSGEPGVMIVIMTDGHENSSIEDVDGSQVKNAIQAKELHDKWNFFYLGANQDAWQTGNKLGFGANTYSANFQATSAGTSEAFAMASSAVNYRKSSSSVIYAEDNSGVMRGLGATKNTSDTGDVANAAGLWVPGKTEDDEDDS